MKTINNVQETGNRNIKNFNMKAFAVLTSVAMFSFIFSANAGNSPMPGVAGNIYPSNTAVAPVTDAANLSISFMEAAMEENLEVEDWMTNENLFAPLSVSESEEPMAVEQWMINAENFMEITFTEQSDQALEVENWMLNNKNFTNFTITEETEKANEVEDWMLNENKWGK